MFKAIWERINGEPVATAAVITGAINVGMAFGLQWTAEQVTIVNAFVMLVLGWLVRRKVSPS